MTNWYRREDTRKDDMAHGITFIMHERQSKNTRGEVAYGDSKLHLDGAVSLTLAFDQWKYGDELIAQIFTTEDGRVITRRADKYNRIQIYLGPADINTALCLETIAQEIRRRRGRYVNGNTANQPSV